MNALFRSTRASVTVPVTCATFVSVTLACATTAFAQPALRPPSVPLVTHDPYLSVWSNSDKLTDSATTHWTGREQTLSSLIRIDGKSYRLMGDSPYSLPVLEQTGVQVLPTRTIYSFVGSGVKVTLTFLSPLLPADLDVLSRPLSYLTWDVSATDGKSHSVALYVDASSALTVNVPEQEVVWKREKIGALTALKMGSREQPVLQKSGDNLRIDWGYSYLATASEAARFAIGNNDTLENSFAIAGNISGSDDPRQPRAVRDGNPVAALVFDLGKVGAQTVSRHAMLAYDDGYSIQFIGRNLRPYWRRNGADASQLLQQGEREYTRLQAKCAAFDAELMADFTRLGGVKYAQLAALAHRQALAAQKLVADANGQPLSFSKENFSNGCIATVDVIYPAAPQMLALSPSLLKASLQPIMEYGSSSYWKFPFAPHDIGTYPKANRQAYGGGEDNERNQMPVEESGNLLLLLAALARIEGNTKFSDPFWPTISRWANYLAEKGFDPESQLSTDDFAGHLAHNVNLSAKAIVALGAFSQMAQMRGETETAQKYRKLAQQFATQWVETATEGDHTRLAFDKPDTWSQKYNLVWDSILGLNLFPARVYAQEMAYYRTKLNIYGLPLDNRRDYTKLDWEIWTASLTGKREDLDAIVNPIYDWLNSTDSRVPLTDWYDTKTGRKSGFQARSVVGGVFIPMLKSPVIWRKWTNRDTTNPTGWAPMPSRPSYRALVPTGKDQNGILWKYTLEAPATNWFAPSFNDSSWKQGEAGFGSQGTPGVVIRTPWTTQDIWLRRNFTWNGTLPKSPLLYGIHDDTAEVYLNGRSLGTIAGYNTSYDALSSLPEGVLKTGTNVLAVHCHQDAGGQGIDIGIAQQSN